MAYPGVSVGGGKTDVLATIYQAERADCVQINNNALGLTAAGLAYVGFTLGLGEGLDRWTESGAILLFPLPLLITGAYLSLLRTLGAVRGQSTRAIELTLLEGNGYPVPKNAVAVSAGERVMSFPDQQLPHRLANLLTYCGILTTLVVCTLYCWYEGFLSAQSESWKWVIGGIVHVVLLSIVILSWLWGIRLVKKIRQELLSFVPALAGENDGEGSSS